jgi:hypothetical protein
MVAGPAFHRSIELYCTGRTYLQDLRLTQAFADDLKAGTLSIDGEAAGVTETGWTLRYKVKR